MLCAYASPAGRLGWWQKSVGSIYLMLRMRLTATDNGTAVLLPFYARLALYVCGAAHGIQSSLQGGQCGVFIL
jgi:hypothetical protein